MSSKTKRLSDAARAALSRIIIDNDFGPTDLVALRTAPDDKRLARPVYLELNAALETLGATWSKKQQAHIIDAAIGDNSVDEIRERLAAIVDTGSFERPDDMGYFPTPRGIVDYLIMLAAPISQGHRVLEPSAGRGAIADALRSLVPAERITLVEIQEQHAAALRAKGYDVLCADFMTVSYSNVFDRIIMNPPFARGQAIDHVLHAWPMLAPGGMLASVMPYSVAFRRDAKHASFRDFVERAGGSISLLPDGAFRESGTDVKTVAVVIQK